MRAPPRRPLEALSTLKGAAVGVTGDELGPRRAVLPARLGHERVQVTGVDRAGVAAPGFFNQDKFKVLAATQRQAEARRKLDEAEARWLGAAEAVEALSN